MLKLKAFYAMALGLIASFVPIANANTIQLNFTGVTPNGGNTTYSYDVLLLSNSQTPASVALFDILGFAGNVSFAATGYPSAVVPITELVTVFPPKLGVDNPLLSNVRLEFPTAAVTGGTSPLSLGTLKFDSTLNTPSAPLSFPYSVTSQDFSTSGSIQFTGTFSRGPASNAPATPLPLAAAGALPLLSLLGLKRRPKTA